MKIIKNVSMQGLSIPFGTPQGVKSFFLAPKKSIEVPDMWKSKIAENLVHRRMVKIIKKPDALEVKNPINKTPKRRTPKSN